MQWRGATAVIDRRLSTELEEKGYGLTSINVILYHIIPYIILYYIILYYIVLYYIILYYIILYYIRNVSLITPVRSDVSYFSVSLLAGQLEFFALFFIFFKKCQIVICTTDHNNFFLHIPLFAVRNVVIFCSCVAEKKLLNKIQQVVQDWALGKCIE
jgi:hypothetical protein